MATDLRLDKFKVVMDTLNDAFGRMPYEETARLLEWTAEQVRLGKSSGVLRDYNGAKVGYFNFS